MKFLLITLSFLLFSCYEDKPEKNNENEKDIKPSIPTENISQDEIKKLRRIEPFIANYSSIFEITYKDFKEHLLNSFDSSIENDIQKYYDDEKIKFSKVSLVNDSKVDDLIVDDYYIQIITPEETKAISKKINFKVDLNNGKSFLMPIILNPLRPTNIKILFNDDEPKSFFQVKGLSEKNEFIENELSFSILGVSELDPLGSAATIFVPTTSEVIDISKYWEYDDLTNSLVIPKKRMPELLNSLPAKDFYVDMGLVTADASDGAVTSFYAFKGIAKIAGKIVDRNGNSLKEFVGQKISIVGADEFTLSNISMIIDENGFFSSKQLLPEGIYNIRLLNLINYDLPKTFVIKKGSTEVNIEYVTDSLFTPQNQLSGSFIGANITQNNLLEIPDREREVFQELVDISTQLINCVNNSDLYQVTSDKENKPETCNFQHNLEQGVKSINIEVTAITSEFPTWTKQRSKYNDVWYYRITNLDNQNINKFHRVNSSHYSRGTLTENYCINTEELTKQSSHTIYGKFSSINVGDNKYPTTVKIKITKECLDELKISSAQFQIFNKNSFRVITPKNTSGDPPINYPGNYISLPTITNVTDWGIPFNISYKPKNIKINKISLGVINSNYTVDITDQANKIENGEISFKDLKIPQNLIQKPISDKVQFFVLLEGSDYERKYVSEKYMVNLNNTNDIVNTTFTPLFLASDYFVNNRRYGVEFYDVGGDSWATYSTLSYLKNNLYRFNDISALHLAQKQSNGRSVLGHSGHSDGMQIDLRYADDLGGYSDMLGGVSNGLHIRNMLINAQKTGDLQQAINWINNNRKLLEKESKNARVIYAGLDWIKSALDDGKFPDGSTDIFNVGRWHNKPKNVIFANQHLHHWHISLKK